MFIIPNRNISTGSTSVALWPFTIPSTMSDVLWGLVFPFSRYHTDCLKTWASLKPLKSRLGNLWITFMLWRSDTGTFLVSISKMIQCLLVRPADSTGKPSHWLICVTSLYKWLLQPEACVLHCTVCETLEPHPTPPASFLYLENRVMRSASHECPDQMGWYFLKD